MTQPRPFVPEALVDFVDDALLAPRVLTPRDVDAMMAKLAAMGIRRVSWGYYGDGHGGFLCPERHLDDYNGGWPRLATTYRTLGNPLKVAVEAGHRHGMEVYAYFKPYEMGPAMLMPEGSPAARENGLLDHLGGRLGWMEAFVRDNPRLRMRRRRSDGPNHAVDEPIHAIRLVKSDDKPTRITREHLQIWTSERNWQYQRKDVSFEMTQSVEPSAKEVRDHTGRLVTAKGAPVRVLTLSGFSLRDKYVLVTTDFTDASGDFSNSGASMIEALDAQGRAIEGVTATGGTVYCRSLIDFRERGLTYDFGWGRLVVTLDKLNSGDKGWQQGFIAFARGRNEFLPGPLCETEPAVQAYWLACLEEIIEAGVDGVDLREENHGTHTDYPEEYGFNDVVLAQCGSLKGEALRQKVAAVRGDAYTEFLRACKSRLSRAGKAMRYNLQADFFRPDPPAERLLAYPLNIDFQWRRWIDEGLLDGVILRSYSLPGRSYSAPLQEVLLDPIAHAMIEASVAAGLPVAVNRYVNGAGKERLSEEVRHVRADARLGGFIFYEVSDYLKFEEEGRCVVAPWVVEAAGVAAEG
ncbi:MAG: hypothetical protein NTW19_09825 [Planctomycetota bacterium]|nr:hypothetical protein [Planctomycetota bacterium]